MLGLLAPAARRAFATACMLLAFGCRKEAGGEAGRLVLDGLGRPVVVPASPRRVVSLAPSVTDAVVALGFGDRLVGVTDFCTVPPHAVPIARIGGMLNPSLETIKSLRPDLLIGSTSGNDPSLVSETEALGLPLYTVHTPDVETTLRSLVDLSALLGDRGKGETLAGGLRRRLDAVRRHLTGRRPSRVLYVVWAEPLVVPGRPAFLSDALRRAGAISVTEDSPAAWPSFDLESVIARAPEAILTTARNRALAERLRSDPAWARVPAVRTGQVLVVSDDIEKPGPAVVSGIEEVARRLHPDAFPEAPGATPEKN